MPVEDIYLEADEKMSKTQDLLKEELRTMRSGRATAGLVEHIRVDYYGSMTPLRQIANIAVPDPRLLVVKPYDPSSLEDIVKAILKSDIGITPNSDGKIIRLAVPPLSEDRRKQLAGRLKQMGEESKVSVRNIRREANREIDKEKKDSAITEDDAFKGKEEIQELIKQYEDEIDALIEKKTTEIMEI